MPSDIDLSTETGDVIFCALRGSAIIEKFEMLTMIPSHKTQKPLEFPQVPWYQVVTQRLHLCRICLHFPAIRPAGFWK